MSNASTPLDAKAEARIERLQPWVAALISALLHVLLLLLLLMASKPTVTTPQGAASGSRMKVDFVGDSRPSEQVPSPPPSPSPVPTRAASPVQSTLVKQAKDPVPPPDAAATSDRVAVPRTQENAEPRQAQAPAATPRTPPQRRPETWTGRPPGMLAEDVAPADEGLATGPAADQGNRNDAAAREPSMEVGGYQVYYDLRSETLLRSWKEQGMKEIAVPLPGTQYRMVCPLEIALRRGAGKCRLLDPGSPQMQAIGDGREVINMIQVYRQGEVVWRGPGPYR
ncbi:MAG TPA: type II toxin-antitoxin system RelE/ParE family toxin [Stenotrophomonas sp.]|jgi:hypothetical protein